MPTASDAQLVRRVRAGDQDAFATLVERYTPLLHGVLLDRVRRFQEVEDLIQEVFARAYEGLDSLDDPRRFGAWLHRLACNVGIDWLRRRAARRQAHVQLALEPRPLLRGSRTPGDDVEAQERATMLWEALDQLAPEYRRVVVLHYIEGCPQKDIARFLGISLATVKWRLMRARSRLQGALIDLYGPEISHAAHDQRELREKILAGLPLVARFRPPPPRLGQLLWRLAATAAVVATAGLAYLASLRAASTAAALPTSGVPGLRARLADVDIPALSVTAAPTAAHRGDPVTVRALGPALEGEGIRPEVHLIEGMWSTSARVVPMVRDGEGWAATVTMPQDATGFDYYIAAQPSRSDTSFGHVPLAWHRWAARFDHHVDARDDDGHPVRDACTRRAILAERSGAPARTIQALAAAELRRYPDNADAHAARWRAMWQGGTRADTARADRDIEAVTRAFPDRPDILWTAASYHRAAGDSLWRTFFTRFPGDERADDAAYRYHAKRATGGDAAPLQAFIQRFPDSPYLDEAYTRILADSPDTVALAVADSIIQGQVVVRSDPRRESEQTLRTGTELGLLVEGVAYSRAFGIHLEAGRQSQAEELVRRLIDTGPADPWPYRNIGRRLGQVGQDDLAIEVLEAGYARVTRADPNQVFMGRTAWAADEVRAWSRRERQELLQWLAEAQSRAGRPRACLETTAAALALSAPADERFALKDQRRVVARIHLARAQALEALGRTGDAVAAYARANAAATWLPEARQALNRRLGPRGAAARLALDLPRPGRLEIRDDRGDVWTLDRLRGHVAVLLYDTHDTARQRCRAWLGDLEADLGPDGLAFYVSGSRASPTPSRGPVRTAVDDTGIFEALQLAGPSLVVLDRLGAVQVRRPLRLYDDGLGVDREALRALLTELLTADHRAVTASAAGVESHGQQTPAPRSPHLQDP